MLFKLNSTYIIEFHFLAEVCQKLDISHNFYIA